MKSTNGAGFEQIERRDQSNTLVCEIEPDWIEKTMDLQIEAGHCAGFFVSSKPF